MDQTLRKLLQHPAIWRASDGHQAAACTTQATATTPSGFPSLDKELPGAGWPQNELVEILCPRWGCGEWQLLGPALATLSRRTRWIAWISPPWIPYAPTLASQGVKLANVLLVRPETNKECLWAMEQCLASGNCSAVLGWPASTLPQHLKRLQAAARKGQCWCLLLRPEDHAQQPSPAPLRIRMGAPGLRLQIIKRRGNWSSDWIQLPEKPLAPEPEPTQSEKSITPVTDEFYLNTVRSRRRIKHQSHNTGNTTAPPVSTQSITRHYSHRKP